MPTADVAHRRDFDYKIERRTVGFEMTLISIIYIFYLLLGVNFLSRTDI